MNDDDDCMYVCMYVDEEGKGGALARGDDDYHHQQL